MSLNNIKHHTGLVHTNGCSICTYVYTYVPTYIYTFTVHMHACMQTHTYACTHMCMYICMHTQHTHACKHTPFSAFVSVSLLLVLTTSEVPPEDLQWTPAASPLSVGLPYQRRGRREFPLPLVWCCPSSSQASVSSVRDSSGSCAWWQLGLAAVRREEVRENESEMERKERG